MAELIWDGKYDEHGKKRAPVRIELPFQTVETVNESVQERQRTLELSSSGNDPEWRNRLIWGDNKYVLPSLLQEFAGKVDLIYIDPPFATGQDFSFRTQVDGEEFKKVPSIIEQKAYRDTWGRGTDSYLQMMYERLTMMRELLAGEGSIFVHCDWHAGYLLRSLLDEVFGSSNFRNEIVWWYYNKLHGNINRFASNHDTILWYTKSENYHFNRITEPRESVKRQQKRAWDPATQSLKQARDDEG